MAVGLAQILVVNSHDCGVLIALTICARAVVGVYRLGSQRGDIYVASCVRVMDRLTAAVDTAAGTRHYLYELIRTVARLNLFHEYARIGKRACNRYLDFLTAQSERSGLDALLTSHIVIVYILEFLALDKVCNRTQGRFHNSARSAEYYTRARP